MKIILMNIEYKYGQIIKGLCGNIRILFNDGVKKKKKRLIG